MKWFNSKKRTPAHNQEVLIRIDDMFHIAIYDADKKCFTLRDKKKLMLCDHTVMWAELVSP
jgi:hypothetical protein